MNFSLEIETAQNDINKKNLRYISVVVGIEPKKYLMHLAN